jgi:hypothetical protein
VKEGIARNTDKQHQVSWDNGGPVNEKMTQKNKSQQTQ